MNTFLGTGIKKGGTNPFEGREKRIFSVAGCTTRTKEMNETRSKRRWRKRERHFRKGERDESIRVQCAAGRVRLKNTFLSYAHLACSPAYSARKKRNVISRILGKASFRPRSLAAAVQATGETHFFTNREVHGIPLLFDFRTENRTVQKEVWLSLKIFPSQLLFMQ